MTMKIVAALILATGIATSAEAGINKRQATQRARIAQGIASGELTRREAVKLTKEQVKIARMETRMRSDGKLTKKERAKLNARLARASRHVTMQKNDAQDRN